LRGSVVRGWTFKRIGGEMACINFSHPFLPLSCISECGGEPIDCYGTRSNLPIGGNVDAETVVNSPGDGHTLLMVPPAVATKIVPPAQRFGLALSWPGSVLVASLHAARVVALGQCDATTQRLDAVAEMNPLKCRFFCGLSPTRGFEARRCSLFCFIREITTPMMELKVCSPIQRGDCASSANSLSSTFRGEKCCPEPPTLLMALFDRLIGVRKHSGRDLEADFSLHR
jgi:hypothetical protein